MGKVVLYIAMSLDGCIADENGGVAWLGGDGSDNENMGSYPEFIKTVGTVILGYKTYRQIVTELSPDNWIYAGKKSYVITHNKLASTDAIIFTDSSVDKLIKQLKSENEKNIWICGGASIVNQLISLNLIDEFCISIVPIILGRGIRLFDIQKCETKLKLISTHSYNGITDLVYKVRSI